MSLLGRFVKSIEVRNGYIIILLLCLRSINLKTTLILKLDGIFANHCSFIVGCPIRSHQIYLRLLASPLDLNDTCLRRSNAITDTIICVSELGHFSEDLIQRSGVLLLLVQLHFSN